MKFFFISIILQKFLLIYIILLIDKDKEHFYLNHFAENKFTAELVNSLYHI